MCRGCLSLLNFCCILFSEDHHFCLSESFGGKEGGRMLQGVAGEGKEECLLVTVSDYS